MIELGADFAYMGTRFIATEEARAHENYKRRITEIDEDGTVVTRAHSPPSGCEKVPPWPTGREEKNTGT